MSVVVTHALVTGSLPMEGAEIEQALDAAAAKGFYVHHTTVCAALDGESAYYVATLAKQEESREPQQPVRKVIGMGAKSSPSKQAPTDVNSNSNAEPGNPG